jgi:hypothetical protein
MDLHVDTLHTYLSRVVPFGFAGAALVAHKGEMLFTLDDVYQWHVALSGDGSAFGCGQSAAVCTFSA